MAIRVTQQTMYNKMVGGMQSNLGAYMESIQQGSSQKKVNRPSDDPAGTYRILTTRVDLTSTAQYKENVDTAKGWLNLADEVLSNQATVAIQGLKTLAEQASTGTYDAGQRQIMADQARQYLGQLLNLSNTRFEGKTIFAGHKYDESAFEMGLGVTSWDENFDKLWQDGAIKVEGASTNTIMVQFTSSGQFGQADPLAYRWTADGGKTWSEDQNLVLNADGNYEITANGVKMTIDQKATVIGKDENDKEQMLSVLAADKDAGPGANNGTMLYIRPAVYYQGDDKDPPAQIKQMGTGTAPGDVTTQGEFSKNVVVRFDGVDNGDGKYGDITVPSSFTYSYSTDGGATWITPLEAEMDATGHVRLPVPGGCMEIDGSGGISAGGQMIIHPSRSDLDYEILQDTYISVNSVGKDVFGGVYQGKPALEGDDNLFEVVGKFIGYLEGNNQEGCQQTLAALTTSEKQLLAEATRIGGIENRISMAEDVLSFQKLDQEERLSYAEDIDLTELLSKLTRQQIAYQTVLQSSSMIMKLSLANYV